MVQTHAPNPRRIAENSSVSNSHWTLRFRKVSASRLNRKTSFLTLASCALLLPGSLSPRSEADQTAPSQGHTPVSSSSVSSPSATLDNSAALLPSQPLLQPPASPEMTLAVESNSPAAQPGTLPKMVSEAVGNVAASPASSLSGVTQIAPLPAESRPIQPKLAAAPSKMRLKAIVGGQERQAQIVVIPKLSVGQALAAMGISLAALDRVVPNASALAREGMTVRVTRIGSKLQKRRTAIPATLRYQPSNSIAAGTKKTIQEAKPGALEITERVWTRDGKTTKREFVSQRLAIAPRPKIVALGVRSHLMPNKIRPHRRYAAALSFRGGTPRDRMLPPADPRTFKAAKSVSVLATGYSAGPAGGAIGNWTATGVRCTYGAVAVDPRFIPLGSKLYIEGYGYGFACDTGGAIKGAKIDLAFDSPRDAFRHGRKRTKVWILSH